MNDVLTVLDEYTHNLSRALQLAWEIDSGRCVTSTEMLTDYYRIVNKIRDMKQTLAVT